MIAKFSSRRSYNGSAVNGFQQRLQGIKINRLGADRFSSNSGGVFVSAL